jgi:hypothetical protein
VRHQKPPLANQFLPLGELHRWEAVIINSLGKRE